MSAVCLHTAVEALLLLAYIEDVDVAEFGLIPVDLAGKLLPHIQLCIGVQAWVRLLGFQIHVSQHCFCLFTLWPVAA